MRHQTNGFITVVLSIILVTVLALLGTTVESARFNVAKAVIERALFTSMDSILAEYNIPVFDKYHVFMLDGGFETQTFQRQKICSRAEEYMTAAFFPYKDLNKFSQKNCADLLGLELRGVELSKQRYIYENKGMLFRGQAVKYEKYLKGMELLNTIKDKFTPLKHMPANTNILSAKLEIEEDAARIDQSILNLIKYIDGISTNSRGIIRMVNGRLKIENIFAKKVYSGTRNMASFGIKNQVIFENVINHAVNAGEILNQIKNGDKDIRHYTKEKKTREDKICRLENNKKQKKEEKRLLKEIEELNKQLYKTYEKMGKDKRILLKAGKEAAEGIKKAIQEIKSMKENQQSLNDKFKKFEKKMQQNQKESDPDLYNEIWTDYKEIKKTNTQIDSNKLNTILAGNLKIINALSELENLSISEEQEDLEMNDRILDSLIKRFYGYNTKDMVLHYDGLMMEKNAQSPFECITRLLSDGIISLVMDQPKNLSKKRLDPEYLISRQLSAGRGQEDVSIETAVNGCAEGYDNAITKAFKNLGKDLEKYCNIRFSAENILFQDYLFDHLTYFKEEKSKENIFDYEVEYCISGKTEEEKNIKSILNKLLLIRVIANLSYLITDKQKKNEAYAAAVTAAGLSGIPALTKLIQTTLLILWSFEESLIDIRALFDGNAVPILKDGTTFRLKYKEMFTINKQMIKEKAGQYTKEYSGNMNYKDYLTLLLLMVNKEQLNYRSLDIIQENIRKKENADFLISNCLYSITIRGMYGIKLKFLNMPFIRNNYGINKDSYSFELEREYSY